MMYSTVKPSTIFSMKGSYTVFLTALPSLLIVLSLSGENVRFNHMREDRSIETPVYS